MTERPVPIWNWLSRDRDPGIKVAFKGRREFTLQSLRRDAVAMALRLNAYDRGTRAAGCVDDGYLFAFSLLALLHRGMVPVLFGQVRRQLLLEMQDDFDLIITDNIQLLNLPGSVDCAHLPSGGNEDLLLPIAPEAVIELHTSGSTGQPKTVSKSVSDLYRESCLLHEAFAGRLKDCFAAASVPPYHMFGLTSSIFFCLSCALPFRRGMIRIPEELSALPEGQCFFISSPNFLRHLDPQLKAPDFAMILSAGGRLDLADCRRVSEWTGIAVHEIYGSTEAGVMAWRSRRETDEPWQTFTGITVSPSGDGFALHSPLVPDGFLELDDLLVLNDSAHFFLAGRRDEIVKLGEKKVALPEIERRLRQIPGVLDAAVLVLSNDFRDYIGAVVVADAKLRQLYAASHFRALQYLRAELSPCLDPLALPRRLVLAPELADPATGKVSKTALKELFDEGSA